MEANFSLPLLVLRRCLGVSATVTVTVTVAAKRRTGRGKNEETSLHELETRLLVGTVLKVQYVLYEVD